MGEAPPGLLVDADGNQLFEYKGSEGDGPDGSRLSTPGTSRQDPDPASALGPVLRWRMGPHLAVLLGVLAVAAGAWFWWQAASGRPEILPLTGVSPGNPAAGPSGGSTAAGGDVADEPEAVPEGNGTGPAGTVVVHVAGAVAGPGVVQLPPGSRVHEAIAAAGGGTPGADLDRLNLALVVEDGQKIHVPREGEEVPAADTAGAGQDGAAGGELDGGNSGTSVEGKINLNTAGVEELDALPKVGPVLARRIVDWRSEHGAFKSVEELDAVDGVGPKMLEALLPLVTV